ncbi:hypothetical protein OG285_11020 [Streptomyces sp. NBC_01471]|uniref:hypothetical protein n=1 Tax=Streptomyces sp. NBC_01471 TaxID=2903879 RepID=UPI00324D3128
MVSFHRDHVVTEHRDARRGWLLADAELTDPAVAARYAVPFDPMDVPRDRFLVAGEAWRSIRAGEADPKTFGLLIPGAELTGAWFVAGNVRLDLAALNRTETLLWDIWGVGAEDDEGMTDAIRDLYDEVARVAGNEVRYEEARKLFTGHDGLRTPRTVRCLAAFNGPHEVDLRG